MGKERKSKRQLARDEKRARQHAKRVADGTLNHDEPEEQHDAKRRRTDAGTDGDVEISEAPDYIPLDDDDEQHNGAEPFRKRPHMDDEKEFFGMLADEEQEYFRHADEMLELNDFPSSEERDFFLQNVYKEAQGKELKLASSQSCSRLMERLLLLANTRQKKQLFEAFATHFVSLVTHRFASHCCEKLFLQSAPVVTQELSGAVVDDEPQEGSDGQPPASMEQLFLLTLDELGDHLVSLLSDRFASHTLRVLLLVLSGRPLDGTLTKSLLQSKRKEHITVQGASAALDETYLQERAVPSSFTWAVKKIITDISSNMNPTALRVLATHPTGNPVLQLLLELDISLKPKSKDKKGAKEETKEEEADVEGPSLLEQLIPGAPASFNDANSEASSFVVGMLYDPIGSRLLETLVSRCPGKIFKGIYLNILAPRMPTLLRNDIACYPAIQALNRLSKEDLSDAVQRSLAEVPAFVERGRMNVLRTLFERCQVRQANDDIEALLKALVATSGRDWKHLVPKLCLLNEPEKKDPAPTQAETRTRNALISHGSQLVAVLLGISGTPSKAIQASLLALTPDQLVRLATSTPQTAAILTKALATPAANPNFHKILVATLTPRVLELTEQRPGHDVLNAIVAAPSKGAGIAVPFHAKENIMARLADHEATLRNTWLGRSLWRAWKGDLWARRRHDWVRWAKEADVEEARFAMAPQSRQEKQKAGAGRPAASGPALSGPGPDGPGPKDNGRKRKQAEAVTA